MHIRRLKTSLLFSTKLKSVIDIHILLMAAVDWDIHEEEEEGNRYLPLFEAKSAKGRIAYWIYAVSVYVAIALVCFNRLIHLLLQIVTEEDDDDKLMMRRRWWCMGGLLMAELWYSFYYFITQILRSNPIYYSTLKKNLCRRYEEEKLLPSVDIFVCTANDQMEPPLMVINTVLSLMSYNYPSNKLNVYLSDDGASVFMFYALLEASRFSKHWLPFCNQFNIEPRSPSAYFSSISQPHPQPQPPPHQHPLLPNRCLSIKVRTFRIHCLILLLQDFS